MTMILKLKSNTSKTARLHSTFLAALSTLLLLLVEGSAFLTSDSVLVQRRTFCPSIGRRGSVPPLLAQTTRDEAVCSVLDLARKFGPIGALQSPEDQEQVLLAAQGLAVFSDENPARQTLARGEPPHELVYSSSSGGSSGQLFGSVYGKVTQTFNETNFVNAVQLGPVKISLQADLTVKDDWNNRVLFRQTSVKLWGQTVVEKTMKGGGIWKYIFAGTVRDSNGRLQRVRVLEAPSLFVLVQDVTDIQPAEAQ
jgi:hypothetical protein